jgi:hypothetical protein
VCLGSVLRYACAAVAAAVGALTHMCAHRDRVQRVTIGVGGSSRSQLVAVMWCAACCLSGP